MTSLENIRVFTQSAIRIQSKDGVVIYLDPFSLTDAEAAHDADYVFITHAHFDHFSPEDIARVAGDHTELVAPASMGAEVARVATAVNLTAELNKRLSAYSGGMKQRLLLASALLGDPKLLILDEPTAGLDPKERVRLRELLADMAKDRIILVATHVVSDVETVATKVILLRAGKIVDAAPVPELIEKYAPGQGLEDVYLNVFGEGDGK